MEEERKGEAIRAGEEGVVAGGDIRNIGSTIMKKEVTLVEVEEALAGSQTCKKIADTTSLNRSLHSFQFMIVINMLCKRLYSSLNFTPLNNFIDINLLSFWFMIMLNMPRKG